MENPKGYEGLEVWKLAHSLVLKIYQLTKGFPKEEIYGLVSQLRRASASVPINIVEGKGRLGLGEYKQFLSIARGSVNEVVYELLLSKDLGFIEEEIYSELKTQYDRVSQMLNKLIKWVNSKSRH